MVLEIISSDSSLRQNNLIVEAIPQQIVNVSPFRGSSFSMKNYVHHNTSVGFAFPQSHVGENACERTLSWDFLCLCRLSSYGELLDRFCFQFRFAS